MDDLDLHYSKQPDLIPCFLIPHSQMRDKVYRTFIDVVRQADRRGVKQGFPPQSSMYSSGRGVEIWADKKWFTSLDAELHKRSEY
jgi:hypothetical protein